MRRPPPASVAWAVRQTILAHARAEAPQECCGLLVGHARRVELAVPMTNVDQRPRTGFRVDPGEHIAVRRILRRVAPGLEIVGVYHSHPAGPAEPSPRDVAESNYPEWLFGIIGCRGRLGRSGPAGCTVRMFQIRAATALPVAIRWRRSKGSPYRP